MSGERKAGINTESTEGTEHTEGSVPWLSVFLNTEDTESREKRHL